MGLRIESPIWLLVLLIPVLYFAYAWLKIKGNLSREHGVIYTLRVMSVMLLIFAMAGPTLLLPIKEEQILFVVDGSASTAGTDTQ